MRKKFFYYRQYDQMDCGPTCLRMVAKYHGKKYSLQTLREASYISKQGVSMSDLLSSAEQIGFKAVGLELTFEELDREANLPCILFWKNNHFVVLPPQNYDQNAKSQRIIIADPAIGRIKLTKQQFLDAWLRDETGKGQVLILEPENHFFSSEDELSVKEGWSIFFKYLKPFKVFWLQVILGMLVASILTLTVPFLTQALVDKGIKQSSMSFVYLVLISQLAVFWGSTSIEFVRSWLILYISSRINVKIIAEFLEKLMKLPIRFFDSKLVGDIMQRINDHNRIEQFLTSTSITTVFSLLNLIVFSVVLGMYNYYILLFFGVGSIISVIWILYFFDRRKYLDQIRFRRMAENQNYLFEMVTGMKEIKLNSGERSYRFGWEEIQKNLFKINVGNLRLSQMQNLGSSFFAQFKNIIITFLAAKNVIEGSMTLGMMLSVSYIIGQMNAPIAQLLTFFQLGQDARLSLDRMNEIYKREDEDKMGDIKPDIAFQNKEGFQPSILSNSQGIIGKDISFGYGNFQENLVLKNINFFIPFNKTTAIVGESGSGKTTLMKLLLKFYVPTNGDIYINNFLLQSISPSWWREQCGAVMADGYIFSNTIMYNVTLSIEVDFERFKRAVSIANIEEFIDTLPLKEMTTIGNIGHGISSGQKQRILIARAIYKDPHILFLDEATSTLDTKNEKEITEKFNRYFKGRTIIIIAHRLSTVKDADQIIVLDKGEIIEVGNHKSLIEKAGKYFTLIKNQLELSK